MEGERGGHVALFHFGGQAREALVELGDDGAQDPVLFTVIGSPASGGQALPIGKIRGEETGDDGLSRGREGRVERIMGVAERGSIFPGDRDRFLQVVFHAVRLVRQIQVHAERYLNEGPEEREVAVVALHLLRREAALQEIEDRRVAVGRRNHGAGLLPPAVLELHAAGPAAFREDLFHPGAVLDLPPQPEEAFLYRTCQGERAARREPGRLGVHAGERRHQGDGRNVRIAEDAGQGLPDERVPEPRAQLAQGNGAVFLEDGGEREHPGAEGHGRDQVAGVEAEIEPGHLHDRAAESGRLGAVPGGKPAQVLAETLGVGVEMKRPPAFPDEGPEDLVIDDRPVAERSQLAPDSVENVGRAASHEPVDAPVEEVFAAPPGRAEPAGLVARLVHARREAVHARVAARGQPGDPGSDDGDRFFTHGSLLPTSRYLVTVFPSRCQKNPP